MHGCHFFLPEMVRRGTGGHVANVSSMAGFHASPVLNAYTTTKFGVLGFSEALREELRPHRIGVTAICPGMINTPITSPAQPRGELDDPQLRERTASIYARRNYGPDRVARNILAAVQRNRSVAPISPEAVAGVRDQARFAPAGGLGGAAAGGGASRDSAGQPDGRRGAQRSRVRSPASSGYASISAVAASILSSSARSKAVDRRLAARPGRRPPPRGWPR